MKLKEKNKLKNKKRLLTIQTRDLYHYTERIIYEKKILKPNSYPIKC